LPRPPPSTLFPYTTLFRSFDQVGGAINPALVIEQFRRGKAQAVPGQVGENGLVAVAVEQQPERGHQPATTPGSVEQHHRERGRRSEEHTSELQSLAYLVCR